MIAATYCKNEGFRIEDIPVPECGSEEILLRVKAASICGTDVKINVSGDRVLGEMGGVYGPTRGAGAAE